MLNINPLETEDFHKIRLSFDHDPLTNISNEKMFPRYFVHGSDVMNIFKYSDYNYPSRKGHLRHLGKMVLYLFNIVYSSHGAFSVQYSVFLTW